MGDNYWERRSFLKTGAAAAGGLMLGAGMSSQAWAAYPDRNVDVIIPTREGGGADRLFRAFTSVWKNYLNTNFEPGFFPGASTVWAMRFIWENINQMHTA